MPLKQQRRQQLETTAAEDSFWKLPQEERTVLLKEASQIDELLKQWSGLNGLYDDTYAAFELAKEIEDPEFIRDTEKLIQELQTRLEALEIVNLFNGEKDHHDAIVTIHPGAGEPSLPIGHRCSMRCTNAGQEFTVLKWRCWIFYLVKKLGSSL